MKDLRRWLWMNGRQCRTRSAPRWNSTSVKSTRVKTGKRDLCCTNPRQGWVEAKVLFVPNSSLNFQLSSLFSGSKLTNRFGFLGLRHQMSISLNYLKLLEKSLNLHDPLGMAAVLSVVCAHVAHLMWMKTLCVFPTSGQESWADWARVWREQGKNPTVAPYLNCRNIQKTKHFSLGSFLSWMIFITSGSQPMTSHPNWTSTLETSAAQAVDVAAHALVAQAVDAAARVVKLQGRSVQGGPIRSVANPPRTQTHFKITNERRTLKFCPFQEIFLKSTFL